MGVEFGTVEQDQSEPMMRMAFTAQRTVEMPDLLFISKDADYDGFERG